MNKLITKKKQQRIKWASIYTEDKMENIIPWRKRRVVDFRCLGKGNKILVLKNTNREIKESGQLM